MVLKAANRNLHTEEIIALLWKKAKQKKVSHANLVIAFRLL